MPKKDLKTKSKGPTEIAILLYQNYQPSAVYGLMDLFEIANRYMADYLPDENRFIRISHWKIKNQKKNEMECVFDTHPELGANKPSFILIPPSLNKLITPEAASPWAEWVTKQHKSGVSVCSVCSGAFVLGETGLLNGRGATTHWLFKEEFQNRFPKVDLQIEKLVIDDGDVITAGGLMAWIDLGLKLVDRLFGSTVMVQTSRFLLVDPPGREQRFYSSFSPQLHHGDEQIVKVQHWLQATGAQGVTLNLMADKAGMEERTFIRRFKKATGLNPTEYCQQVRVAKAREMLEFTNKNIEEISWKVGYEDTSAFRKVFHKVIGLTPGEYRTKFSVARR
ncbi:GlxA family transcriptional regulator [Bdellovibrio sp. HCB209]|uniref:GlxA family transcriptional regulator n=1 Tax=Bdellovibrio sp. HCB209 TaxID=3394354 RepID=UPI0039B3D83F